MAVKISTSPDYAGVSIQVAKLSENTNYPTTVTRAVPIGHLEDFPTIFEASREVKKYKPLNERDYAQIVSTGSKEYSSISASVLYDPEGAEGINLVEEAFRTNANIGLTIEMNNAKTQGNGSGTTYRFLVRISKFALMGEKDGKVKADFVAEVIGEPLSVVAK